MDPGMDLSEDLSSHDEIVTGFLESYKSFIRELFLHQHIVSVVSRDCEDRDIVVRERLDE
jgi:hypothetical protein